MPTIRPLAGPADQVDHLARIAKEKKLSDSMAQFVKHYVANGMSNRTDALIKAGYKAHLAHLFSDPKYKGSDELRKAKVSFQVQAHLLLSRPKIRAAIEEYAKYHKIERRKEIEKDVFRLTQARATYDIRSIITSILAKSPEEIVEKLDELTDEQAACIDAVKYQYLFGKTSGDTRFVVELKLADRDKSLVQLAKLTGLLTEKKEIEHKGTVAPRIQINVLNQNNATK